MQKLTSKIVERDETTGKLVPVIGASVFLVDPDIEDRIAPLSLRGNLQGTVTDIQGLFLLNIHEDAAFDEIAITHMGKKTILTDVDSIRTTPVFTLEDSVTTTDEIVVTGTPRKKEKESFPDWLIMVMIPVVLAVMYMVYRVLNNNNPGATAPKVR